MSGASPTEGRAAPSEPPSPTGIPVLVGGDRGGAAPRNAGTRRRATGSASPRPAPGGNFQRPRAIGRAVWRGKTAALFRLLALLLLAVPAHAEAPAFNCVGAEQFEDDVFSVPFARNSSRLGDAARTPIDSVLEVLNANPGRVACILGHAGQEGGATTSIRLAAERARAISQALAARGVAPERLRAEARSAHFSPRVRADMPPSRTVTVVVLPAP